jgi:hypothetical protein
MPRREWSRPFGEVKESIIGSLRRRTAATSDELVAETGLPFEDVISALRMLRHGGEVEFEPVWAGPNEMSGAENIRLSATAEKDGAAE